MGQNIKKNIFESQQYFLGKQARLKINKKLYKKVFWKYSNHIKPEDILGSIEYLIKLNKK